MKKPSTKYCSFCNKMEPISNFQENASKPDGLQVVCQKGQNYYVRDYNDRHREAVNQKSTVYHNFKNGKITKSACDSKIRKINDSYGIEIRLK